MVNQRKVEVCMRGADFEVLDEIHCGLEDGIKTIDENIARIKLGTDPPIRTAAGFFRGALESIDSAMAAIVAFEPRRFSLPDAAGILKETRPIMRMRDEAERRGHFNNDELRTLGQLLIDVRPARATAFGERARQLTECLLS